jgi:hypothetical protein
MGNKEKKQEIKQVESASLSLRPEPSEPTEMDVDFKAEESKLAELEKQVKEARAKLNQKKKLAVGGEKLERMTKYAKETTAWAVKAYEQLKASVERANTAVSKLDDYETRLALPANKQQAGILAADLALPTAATEVELKD